MSFNTNGKGKIRAQMIENNQIALPGRLFYTMQIPVCLWFMTKSKVADLAA